MFPSFVLMQGRGERRKGKDARRNCFKVNPGVVPAAVFEANEGVPSLVPVREMQVKSEVARPMRGEVVPAKSTYRIFGAAWAGGSTVVKVEISCDSGKSWHEAKLLDKAVPFTWRRWEYKWQTPEESGPCGLMAWATDADDRVQPMQRDEGRRNTIINHVLPIVVEIAPFG